MQGKHLLVLWLELPYVWSPALETITWRNILQHLIKILTLNNTHTHPVNGPFSGTTQVSRYQKVKPIWILLEQETVSGSGISWAICKCAPCSRQTTTPAPHRSSFLQAGCPSCRPTNSVKALKAKHWITWTYIYICWWRPETCDTFRSWWSL